MAGIEQARLKGMLASLQEKDPDIDHIVAYSQFVVAYLLQQDGANPGWRKANIDGPVYLVRRRVAPRYQLLVKNQFNTSDLSDNLHPEWELDCQNNYVFYKVKDPAKRIRGLWFHHDQERKKIEDALNKVLEELRTQPEERAPTADRAADRAPPPPLAPPAALSGGLGGLPGGLGGPGNFAGRPSHFEEAYGNANFHGAQMGLGHSLPNAREETVTLTMSALSNAWHSMADDPRIMQEVLRKMKDMQMRESA